MCVADNPESGVVMGDPHALEGHSNEQLWQESLESFNTGDYFMTHEYLEELWRRHDGELSKFYQGLLQAAVSLYHYGNGNFHGAKLLARQSTAMLSKLPAGFHGIDLDRFRQEYARLMAPVLEPAPNLKPLAPDEAPRLHPA
ncbi:MAG: hypothetical protein DCC64_14790 [Planctomycetota bacterium]|nr:MAG: hypothetical protein DCC64_14790 [Planctomycetota bacterium]